MKGPRRLAAKSNPFKTANVVGGATITVGTEAANVINVSIQLTDANGNDLATRGVVECYLSADANGDALASAPPTGGVAIGTDGLLIKGQGLAAITALTDNTVGTANNTLESIADVSTAGGNTYADTVVNTVLAKLRNNFADLAAKVNEVIGVGRRFTLRSESDGDIDINITDSGTPTFYLIVLLPNGGSVSSGAITFA